MRVAGRAPTVDCRVTKQEPLPASIAMETTIDSAAPSQASGPRDPPVAPHGVVVVGGGFGGLFATRFLRHAPVEVTLVDRVNHHLFQPLLYQVATGILSEGQIAPPIRNVLRRQRNVVVELAEVMGFDLEARTVTAMRPDGDHFTIPYDSLIVGAGASGSYFGHDEFSHWAPGMKTIDDALEI